MMNDYFISQYEITMNSQTRWIIDAAAGVAVPAELGHTAVDDVHVLEEVYRYTHSHGGTSSSIYMYRTHAFWMQAYIYVHWLS